MSSIAMKNSKSLGSLVLSTEITSFISSAAPPQPRSSLDTLVIPRRTRFPSSNPKPFDTQVATNLINSNIPQQQKDASMEGLHPPVKHVQRSSPHRRSGSRSQDRPHATQATLARLRPQTIGRPASRPPLNRAPVQPHLQEESQASDDEMDELDGDTDPSHDSQHVSTTNSDHRQRFSSESSSRSRELETSQYLEEYNRLATKHGLPELTAESVDEEDQSKTTSRVPNRRWLPRIFRRSKSTYTLEAKTKGKAVTRKKSLGRIPSLSNTLSSTNVLKDKTLEEVCVLGGLGNIRLPQGFAAVDKLAIPTCLAAAAKFLCEEGCNVAGVFRVPGQKSTIIALYDHYALKYAQAGSPSKVQETVGLGELPDLGQTVHDVASLFKQIIMGLPGGLLGSLQLFEAIRAIFTKLQAEPEESEETVTKLRAQLIALAVLSCSSTYREQLIQAICGLGSYFGHEAKRLLEEIAAAGESQSVPGSSELMNFRSLGRVFGPLLLGDLTEAVELNPGVVPVKPTETPKQPKKGKGASTVNKLEQDATLTAYVERANNMAKIMESLLMIWKDVVAAIQGWKIAHQSLSHEFARSESQTGRMGILGNRPTARPQDGARVQKSSSGNEVASDVRGPQIMMGGRGSNSSGGPNTVAERSQEGGRSGRNAGSRSHVGSEAEDEQSARVRHARSTPQIREGSGGIRIADERIPRRMDRSRLNKDMSAMSEDGMQPCHDEEAFHRSDGELSGRDRDNQASRLAETRRFQRPGPLPSFLNHPYTPDPQQLSDDATKPRSRSRSRIPLRRSASRDPSQHSEPEASFRRPSEASATRPEVAEGSAGRGVGVVTTQTSPFNSNFAFGSPPRRAAPPPPVYGRTRGHRRNNAPHPSGQERFFSSQISLGSPVGRAATSPSENLASLQLSDTLQDFESGMDLEGSGVRDLTQRFASNSMEGNKRTGSSAFPTSNVTSPQLHLEDPFTSPSASTQASPVPEPAKEIEQRRQAGNRPPPSKVASPLTHAEDHPLISDNTSARASEQMISRHNAPEMQQSEPDNLTARMQGAARARAVSSRTDVPTDRHPSAPVMSTAALLRARNNPARTDADLERRGSNTAMYETLQELQRALRQRDEELTSVKRELKASRPAREPASPIRLPSSVYRAPSSSTGELESWRLRALAAEGKLRDISERAAVGVSRDERGEVVVKEQGEEVEEEG